MDYFYIVLVVTISIYFLLSRRKERLLRARHVNSLKNQVSLLKMRIKCLTSDDTDEKLIGSLLLVPDCSCEQYINEIDNVVVFPNDDNFDMYVMTEHQQPEKENNNDLQS
jgi:hypothetical protein